MAGTMCKGRQEPGTFMRPKGVLRFWSEENRGGGRVTQDLGGFGRCLDGFPCVRTDEGFKVREVM